MNFLPCIPTRKPPVVTMGQRGTRTWHHHGTSTALHHKLALAGALASFTCIIAAGALAIWTAAATPWAASPVVPIPEPSSVAIFASGIALALVSTRRAKP
jgi:hypothetical protein